MKLVLGLGNPGKEYEMHRHNIGFIMLERLARDIGVEINIRKKKTIFAEGKRNGVEFLLLQPLTFINLSGEAALYMASFKSISVKDIIVIYDEMHIPLGSYKIEIGGDNFEHNGVRSIVNALQNDGITRVAVGIGKPPKSKTEKDFLLSPFSKEEREVLRVISPEIIEGIKNIMFNTPPSAGEETNIDEKKEAEKSKKKKSPSTTSRKRSSVTVKKSVKRTKTTK